MTETSGQVPWDLRLGVVIDHPRYVRPVNSFGVASSHKSEDNYVNMTKVKISAATAEDYGLDREEAHFALLYAAASKEATQRALTATPDETARLKGMKRLASLTLDLYQRLKAAVLLPRILVDQRQADLAGQLSGTFKELSKLEETLFGEPRTRKDDLVAKAGGQATAWRRTSPTTSRPDTTGGGNPTHLAA